MSEITLGNMTLETPKQAAKRLSMMIWGSSGSGKTTLAATAPGKKLWISFDPDGTASIAYRDDILVMDYSTKPNKCVEDFKVEDPIRITKFLEDNPSIETVVFDSLTTFGDKALARGVTVAQGTKKGRDATTEDPGYGGYGNKNTWTRLLVSNLLKATGAVGRNMIFIAHEDKPTLNKEGQVMFISIMLGSSLNEQLPVTISEIWHLHDNGKERKIAVRNCRGHKPVKSRMFKTSEEPEFIWHYDAETEEGEGIEDWYNAWKENNFLKLELPK